MHVSTGLSGPSNVISELLARLLTELLELTACVVEPRCMMGRIAQ